MAMSPDDQALLGLLAAAGLVPNSQNLPADVVGGTSDPLAALQAIQAPLSNINAPVPAEIDSNVAKSNNPAGVSRVNQNTRNTGIHAVVDDQGNITLTNLVGDNPMTLGEDAAKIQKGGASYTKQGQALDAAGNPMAATPDQKAIGTNVQGLISQLRNTNDADAARGIMSQLTESLASEQAKYYQQAQRFAQNKLQIPLIEQQLAAAQANDASVLGYGQESPGTMKLRNTLDNLRGAADTEAKRYLSGNVGYNSLIAASKNAEAEGQRITRLQDSQDKLQLSKDLSRQNRSDIRQEQLEIEAQGLTTEQKNRIRVLNPDLANAPDTQLLQTLKTRQVKNDGYGAALEAPESELPKLAAQNNTYATAILTAKEQAAGVPPELTSARIRAIKTYSTDPKAIRQGLALIGGATDKKAIDAQMATLTSLQAPGATKESKAQATDMKLQAARAVLETQVANQFVGDVKQWAVPDPVFQAAITSAQNTAGKTDIQSVLTAYLGASTGADRRKLLDTFTSYATTAASNTNKSQLGAVDPNKIKNMIQNVETRTFLERVKDTVESTAKLSALSYGVIFNPAIASSIPMSALNGFNNPSENK